MTDSSSGGGVRWWHTLLALVVLLAALAGIVFVSWRALRMVTHLSPTVSASLIAASGTVIVATLSLIGQRAWERRRVIEQEHRRQVAPIYEGFIAAWFKLSGEGDAVSDEVLEALKDFKQKMLLWGSDAVVRQFIAMDKAANETIGSGADARISLLALEQLMRAMRRDLGHKNKALEEADLLRTFITDWDSAAHPGSAVDLIQPDAGGDQKTSVDV